MISRRCGEGWIRRMRVADGKRVSRGQGFWRPWLRKGAGRDFRVIRYDLCLVEVMRAWDVWKESGFV